MGRADSLPDAVDGVPASAPRVAAGWRKALERGFTPTAAVAGFALAWVASSPRWLVYINWDQGHYVGRAANGTLDWSAAPWNAHFAIGNIYYLFVVVARACGGTPIDGFRLANAVCFAAACAVIVDAAWRITGRRSIASLLTAAWATSFVTLFLLLSLEDNVLYLPFAAGVFWLCVVRIDAWRLRHSLAAGALAGLAALQSWQALVYLGPAVWGALLAAAPGRRLLRRALDALAVLGAFLGTLVTWCLVVGLTSKLGVATLLASLFSRPTGSFKLRGLTDVRGALEALGAGASYLLRHDFTFADRPPALPLSFQTIGAILVILVLVALVVATISAWRRRNAGPHVVAAALTAFVLVTPLYIDVTFRYLIRLDFLPLVGVFLAAFAARSLCERWRRAALPIAAVLAAVVVVQSVLTIRWDLRRHAWYPSMATWTKLPHTEPMWYGRNGKSWFWYYRDIRRAHPDACHYLLHPAEVASGNWNLELMGTVLSELPDHLVVSEPSKVAGWKLKPHTVPLAQARVLAAKPCTWVSSDARLLLDGKSPGRRD